MRRVLVPYDGSKTAIRALEYVAERKRRGEKLLVEVLLVQEIIAPIDDVAMDAIANWREDERIALLSKTAFAKVAKESGAKITTQFGDPAERIVAFTRKKHCREVVMGTRGMSRLKGFLMGSVAAKVIQLVQVPVTLVK